MTIKIISASLLFTVALNTLIAQQPKYTAKHFVATDDKNEFIRIVPKKDGFMRTYILATPEIWDVDDDNTTYIKGGHKALICMEGKYLKGVRSGIFNAYLLDSADHKKRFKIWEQTYVDDMLNGEWRTYSLNGNLVRFQTFKNDSLNGIAKDYWIDGKSVVEERVYMNGKSNFILKEYAQNGKVAEETTFVNDIPNGKARKYYPDGVLKDEVVLKEGVPNGLRKYYYPSGKIWIEQELKNGNPWTVIANYIENGQKRNPGTLKEGNGTVLFYNEDGTLRETITYKNGVEM